MTQDSGLEASDEESPKLSGATQKLKEQLKPKDAAGTKQAADPKAKDKADDPEEGNDDEEGPDDLEQLLDEYFWFTREDAQTAIEIFDKNAKKVDGQMMLPTRLLGKVFEALGEEINHNDVL